VSRVAVRLILLALAAAAFLLAPAPSAHAASDAESQFLSLVNQERTSRGVAPLTMQPVVADNLSRPWSAHMAASGQLAHSGSAQQVLDNVSRYFPSTNRAGENVGYASTVRELHQALMNSPAHRANILSADFTSIGLGVAQTGSMVWVTQTFFTFSTVSSPAAPTPWSRSARRPGRSR
jgi:uncharacterized protein YkwD